MTIKTIIAFTLSIILFSCTNTIGTNCSYTQYQGKARIISIDNAPLNENNCPVNAKKVVFVFTPNDTSNRDNYIFKNWSDTSTLTINGSTNPSQNFLDSFHITLYSEFNCERQEITQGTCTPVLFNFTEIDLNPQNGCW
jgi:hypothetical protein